MESINQSYFLVASPEFLVSPAKIAVYGELLVVSFFAKVDFY